MRFIRNYQNYAFYMEGWVNFYYKHKTGVCQDMDKWEHGACDFYWETQNKSLPKYE